MKQNCKKKSILRNSNVRHFLNTLLTYSVSNYYHDYIIANLVRTESKSHSIIKSKKRITIS